MGYKHFFGFIMLYIVLTIFGCVYEMNYIGDSNTTSYLTTLMNIQFLQGTNVLDTIGNVFSYGIEWITAFWNIMWWNFAFFTGSFAILRYAFIALTVGFIATMIFGRLSSSSS